MVTNTGRQENEKKKLEDRRRARPRPLFATVASMDEKDLTD